MPWYYLLNKFIRPKYSYGIIHQTCILDFWFPSLFPLKFPEFLKNLKSPKTSKTLVQYTHTIEDEGTIISSLLLHIHSATTKIHFFNSHRNFTSSPASTVKSGNILGKFKLPLSSIL